jgi:uncharacterized protein (DUF427 family)
VTGGYPLALPPVNHTAPVPRRIRAVLDGHIVVDMTSALYVWEWSDYPQYYIPVDDIDPAVLVDEQHEQKLSRGTARRYALQVGEIVRPAALLIYGDDATVEGLGAFSLGGELWPLPGVADHVATIPAYEFDSPLRGPPE